jgi:hypothetical protein
VQCYYKQLVSIFLNSAQRQLNDVFQGARAFMVLCAKEQEEQKEEFTTEETLSKREQVVVVIDRLVTRQKV